MPRGKSPRYPLARLGGRWSRFDRCGEEKIILPLLGIERRPSSSSLNLLSYPGSHSVKLKHKGALPLLQSRDVLFILS
jgi:hypothetical protein